MATDMTFLGPAISLATAAFLYFVYRLLQTRLFYRGLPGPPHSLLWGHLKVMGESAAKFPPNTHPQSLFTAIKNDYNLQGIYYLDLWPIGPSQVILVDPDLAEEVTVKKPLRQHQMSQDFLGPIVGENVIAVVNGPTWKFLHNAMSPAFSWSHIRSLTNVMVDECKQFRITLDQLAATGEVFSMEATSAKLVFDVIARAVFNVSLHAQTKGSPELDDLREMVVIAEKAVDFSIKYNPWIQLKLYFKRRAVLGRLHPFIEDKVRERYDLLLRDKIVPSRKDPNSILDLMLREKVQNQEKKDNAKESASITPHEMTLFIDNIKGLLLGGHGTTTDSLCYIYMLLSVHPEVLTKIRQECDAVFSPSHTQTIEILQNHPEKLQDLPYMEAAIKETLRLFPVGHGVRAADEGTTLTYKTHKYPIDHNLVISSVAQTMHYDPQFFPNPTKYNPSRWLDPDNNPIPKTHFRAFSRGPRGCLGVNLAMNEMKVILLMTIRDYDFTCAGLKPNRTPRMKWTDWDVVFGDIVFQELGLEAKPRGGMMMTVCRREGMNEGRKGNDRGI